MKKFLALFSVLCIFVTGCGSESTKEKTISQSMQTQELKQSSQEKSDNWVTEGVEKLSKANYKITLKV